mgnify:CR=1 FL=1
MVKRCLLGAALLALPLLSMAQCSVASEFLPALCAVKLPAIGHIQIEENGMSAANPNGEVVDCARFKLSKRQVVIYLRKASQVRDATDALAKLDYSPCSASGSVRFANGKTARWQISETQTGVLVWHDDNASISLYCPTCRYKPFRW